MRKYGVVVNAEYRIDHPEVEDIAVIACKMSEEELIDIMAEEIYELDFASFDLDDLAKKHADEFDIPKKSQITVVLLQIFSKKNSPFPLKFQHSRS